MGKHYTSKVPGKTTESLIDSDEFGSDKDGDGEGVYEKTEGSGSERRMLRSQKFDEVAIVY